MSLPDRRRSTRTRWPPSSGGPPPPTTRVIPFFTSFGERLVETADLALGERVLDAGCGRGATLLPASVAVGRDGPGGGHRPVRGDGGDAGRGAGGGGRRQRHRPARQRPGPGHRGRHLRRGPLPDGAAPASRPAGGRVRALPGAGARAGGAWRRCPSGSPGWEFIGQLFGKFGPRALRPPAVPFRPEFDLPAVLAGAGFEIVRRRAGGADLQLRRRAGVVGLGLVERAPGPVRDPRPGRPGGAAAGGLRGDGRHPHAGRDPPARNGPTSWSAPGPAG